MTESSSPPSQEAPPLHYRPDIDGLRAVAVLAVIGYHAFPQVVPGGYVGVDIFFVISGYLITTILLRDLNAGRPTYRRFYARRIRRIFPALIVVLLASLAAGWWVMLANDYRDLGQHLMGGAGFFSNFTLWRESGYFDKAAELKPLLHLWSLSIEEQFYICWPLLLYVARRYRLNFLAFAALLGLCSFAVNIAGTAWDNSFTFYSPIARFWELLVGCALARLMLNRPRLVPQFSAFGRWRMPWPKRSANAALVAVNAVHLQMVLGGTLIGISLFSLSNEINFPGWWALLPTAGAALVIASGMDAPLNRWILANPLMVGLGLISYPLYLWHWPLLSFARMIEIESPSWQIRVAIVLSSALLAWLTYALVERPLRFGKSASWKPLSLCALMLMAGVLGYGVYKLEGVPSRLVNKGATHLGEDDLVSYRSRICFLGEDQDQSAFAPDCSEDWPRSSGRPLVLLWGDSHAASLYPGLKQVSSDLAFDLAQFTASGCPPIAGFQVDARPHCASILGYVHTRIRELRPNVVIMAAHWSLYSGLHGWNRLDYAKLQQTIRQLQDQKARVIVFGHLPVFTMPQPMVGLKVFRLGATARTYEGFDGNSARASLLVSAAVKSTGADFVSPIQLLCDGSGCLISLSSSRLVPLAWDNAHLTQAGSSYLVYMALSRDGLKLP